MPSNTDVGASVRISLGNRDTLCYKKKIPILVRVQILLHDSFLVAIKFQSFFKKMKMYQKIENLQYRVKNKIKMG